MNNIKYFIVKKEFLSKIIINSYKKNFTASLNYQSNLYLLASQGKCSLNVFLFCHASLTKVTYQHCLEQFLSPKSSDRTWYPMNRNSECSNLLKALPTHSTNLSVDVKKKNLRYYSYISVKKLSYLGREPVLSCPK